MVRDVAKLLVLAGCLVGLVSGGCSSSGGSGTGDSAVPLAEFPEQFAAALCDTIAPCCATAHIAYSSATCKQNASAEASQIVSDGSAGDKTYDAAQAARCLAAVKKSLASCIDLDDAVHTACSAIFVGEVPSNSSQPHGAAGDECVGDCNVYGGTAVCQRFATGQEASIAYCYDSDELYCAFDTRTCAKFGKVGETCSGHGCVAGAYCKAGKCAATIDSGSCSENVDACSSKSYCNFDGECTQRKSDGESCFQNSECARGACLETPGSDTEGTCGVTPAASAERCAGHLG